MRYASVQTGAGTKGYRIFAFFHRLGKIPPADRTHLPNGWRPRFATNIVSMKISDFGYKNGILPLMPCGSGSGAQFLNQDTVHPFQAQNSFWTGLRSSTYSPAASFGLGNVTHRRIQLLCTSGTYLVPSHLQSPGPSPLRTWIGREQSNTFSIAAQSAHREMKWCSDGIQGRRRKKRTLRLST